MKSWKDIREWLDSMCHEFTPGPMTTETSQFVCGRCGGDRRMPVKAKVNA